MASRKNLPSRFDIDMTPLHDFMKQMDTFFNRSFKQMNDHFQLNPFWLEVKEKSTHFIIEAELHGYKKDQIKIEVAGNRIKLGVEDYRIIDEEDKKNSRNRREQSFFRKERVITLPFDIPKEEIKASYKENVLTITVPKPKVDYIEIEDS